MKPLIHEGVVIGKGAVIDDDVEIGRPGKDTDKSSRTVIGTHARIRRGTIIYAGVTIGNHLNTGHYSLVRERNIIGDNVSIGSFTELALRNKIGDNTRIHSRCFLEDVILGKNIFVGPSVLFTNDPHPPSGTKFPKCLKGATVDNNAVIGGGVVVLPHVHIGEHALIGAGSVVVKDVRPHTVVVGNPARTIKKIEDMVCRRVGELHRPYAKYVR